MTALVVHDVDVFYGQVQALRGVSLEVNEGERVALLGANGAGKTTTLRAISGLLAPRRGAITFGGKPISGLPSWDVIRLGIAHLPEGRDLFTELSVYDNLKMGFWTKRHAKSALAERIDVVMHHFPILRERATQAAGTLSGGEQQMLGVARALMSAPRLLVIDELSLGLAPKIVEQIFAILRDVNTEGTAVLLVEQFVHLALAETNRAYVLAKGEVVMSGQSASLLDDPGLIESYLGGSEVETTPDAETSQPRSRRTTRPAASSA